MRKNDVLTETIKDYGYNCEGICKSGDTVCFVPYTLVNEKVCFKVLKVNKNVAYCKALEILTPEEDRVRPVCRVYGKCGGCQLQHLVYSEQLKLKSKIVADCFRKIAGIKADVNQTVPSKNEYGYRNKLQLPVRHTEYGNAIGFFAENSHRVIKVDDCPIQKSGAKEIIAAFNEFIIQCGVSCYDESTGKGLLRHIVVRFIGDAAVITVVINGKTLPRVNDLIDILSASFKKFSLYLNENTENNNVITGENYTLVYGEGSYFNEEFSVKYPVTVQSFMQVNDDVKVKLYSHVVSTVEKFKANVVIDAYSGAGVMTAMLASYCDRVIGIEIIPEAVSAADALKNGNAALKNKMTNVCAPCEKVLPEIVEKETQSGNKVAVVLDPPRKGCDIKVISALLKSKPEHIVYVSCSPQTLARDAGLLVGTLEYDGEKIVRGSDCGVYEITEITPFDMFPQTKHVETLVCFKRKTAE